MAAKAKRVGGTMLKEAMMVRFESGGATSFVGKGNGGRRLRRGVVANLVGEESGRGFSRAGWQREVEGGTAGAE